MLSSSNHSISLGSADLSRHVRVAKYQSIRNNIAFMEQTESITAEQRYHWRIALELKLRKSHGDAFQDFFSNVMAQLHGDDFVRVRPFGALGDKGCDGYLVSSGQLFQCYGALAGELKTVAKLIEKMNDDYSKARAELTAIMNEWYMVHNLIEGMPVEAILTLKALEESNKTLKFGFIGIEGFEERIFKLKPFQIAALLGPTVSDFDSKDLDISALRKLVQHLSAEADTIDFATLDLRPVPPDKLLYNDLPNHWKYLITGGWKNAHLVSTYFDRHPEPLTGERVAKLFREHYKYLKAQNLAPSNIMASLYELVTGIGTVPQQEQVAVQALLAFLFENCDIFERNPVVGSS